MEKINLNVMYLEDQKSIRQMFADYFEGIFDNFYVCKDGQEAYELFEKLHVENKKVDLVITDIEMPNMNGFEFLEKVREFDNDLQGIIISGLDFGNYIENINKILKVNSFVSKPIHPEKLYDKIKSLYPKIKATNEYKLKYSLTKQYENAINNSAIITKTDLKGFITYANDAFCEISGYKEEELLGQAHNLVRDPDIPKEVFATMWRTIKAKMIFRHSALPNKAKDGSKYYVDTVVIPILDENRNIYEYLSLRYDVTSLIESISAERKAKDIQRQFLATMSHEIRTPLNGILGFVNLLEESENLSKIDKEYVNTINESAGNLMHIINEILDISKIQSGKIELENSVISISKLCHSVHNLFQAKADDKSIEYKINLDNSLEKIHLLADETKLKQIFSNLINNAIKFTPEYGKVECSLLLKEVINQLAHIEFKVKDTGIGISEENLKNIFNSFVQENQSVTREFGGTGLGLAICKELITLMNGSIDVESTKGNGSIFTVSLTLPIEDKKIEDNITKAETTDQYSGTILVAEDVPINQKLMTIQLEKLGFKVLIANNGQEGIDLFEKNVESLSLVLMDINMPILDGITAMQRINALDIQKEKEIPIVALTANAIKGDREKFLNDGFTDYLSKPINDTVLKDCLSKYIISINEDKDKCGTSYDLNAIAEQLGIPIDMYKEFFNEYITLIESDLPPLKEAIKNNDNTTIKNIAHKLKGTSGNLGLDELYELFKTMETSTDIEKYIIKIENITIQLNKRIKK